MFQFLSASFGLVSFDIVWFRFAKYSGAAISGFELPLKINVSPASRVVGAQAAQAHY